MSNNLLLIKVHFFCFFAALGPILPFLGVIGKQIGISEVVIGLIFSVVPVLYFITKPLYGYVLDYFVKQRTIIFTITVAFMGLFYVLIYFVARASSQEDAPEIYCASALLCDMHKHVPPKWTVNQICNLSCNSDVKETEVELRLHSAHCNDFVSLCNESQVDCHLACTNLDPPIPSIISATSFYKTSEFWIFVLLVTLGLISFNILNSATDAICLNALGYGNEMQYGSQRIWGTIGYGISAFVAGYYIDYLSGGLSTKNNTPSFVLLIFFICLDVIVCSRLKFGTPTLKPERIAKEVYEVLWKPHVMLFVGFTLFIGVFDGFLIYYLFWFLEVVAEESDFYPEIRLIEGLTVLGQSFGGELLIFPLAGKIIQKIGYGNSLTLCFLFFAMRLYFLSYIPNPWWALLIETIFHGLTYAFSYTVIVGYVSSISTHAIQSTMQGMVSGVYDGFGYAFGSFFGGILCTIFSLREIFELFAGLASIVGIVHYVLYIFYLREKYRSSSRKRETRSELEVAKNTEPLQNVA